MVSKALLVALAIDQFSYAAEGRFRLRHMQLRPLLGLAYIRSAIESCGLRSELLDQSVTGFSLKDMIRIIREEKYLFVGFYSQLLIKDKLSEYIKAIKIASPQTRIIVGGPGHLFCEEFLKSGCDIVCRGEGEFTVIESIGYLRGEKKIEDIDGIVYLKDGKFIYNKERRLADDLDSLPFPLWDASLRSYYDSYILPLKTPFAPMVTSRGCMFKCAFCSSPYLWKNIYRRRSVENVIREIDSLVFNMGVRYIVFQDDVFGMDNMWLRKFCSVLSDRGYRNLRWMCILHPLVFQGDARESIERMKEAGCDLFVFGLQTANPGISKKINRSPEEAQALEKIIRLAHGAGIMTAVDFILGFPGETRNTINENIDFALSASPYLVNFHPLRLEPGSQLARDYEDKCSSFSQEELLGLCRTANRRFYFNVKNLLKIACFLLKNNPLALLRMRKLSALLRHYAK